MFLVRNHYQKGRWSLRTTLQREIILDTVQNLHHHATAEEVYAAIHEHHPTISKATVYRNLQRFAQQGELVPLQLEGDATRYDRRLHQHYHFKCRDCGAIFDVDMEPLKDINQRAKGLTGFAVDAHDIVFRGVCSDCAAKE